MKQTKKSERERHIQAWSGSGLSKTEYCRQKELQRSTFYRWLREQREEKKATDGFIEIAIDRFNPQEQIQSSAGEIGIVLPNGYRMTVGQGFDPETFEHVLTVLEVR
jgi:hypothetical protein